MRNALGLAVAAALLGSVSASGQMRPAPNLAVRVQGLHLPYRTGTYAPIRQAPPARIVFIHPVAGAAHPSQLVAETIPASSSATSPATQSNFASTNFGGTPIPLDQLLNPVPGLGFDYTHLAVVNSNLAIRAFIDPITEHELGLTEQLPQEQPVGFFPGYGEAVPVESSAQQPEVIVVQQPVAQPSEQVPAASPAAEAPATPAPPLPNVGAFLLVRRDGKVVHAIAFSQQGTQVIYITANGARRSMSLDDLDIAATEHRNAERGTILHLSQ